ncbi:hypothetical protein PR202_gb24550 [Eleusine coracana subsp. coracana]|uniref:Uncharacterized protein n=1 Tax=Eleusine coracana subsp. coracana TaxID=191504 RepID=A0AAV5FLD1_ELECO|nr:hypothetical protein PR202_gb24550 [Eleusine coracana subsp. coracana]
MAAHAGPARRHLPCRLANEREGHAGRRRRCSREPRDLVVADCEGHCRLTPSQRTPAPPSGLRLAAHDPPTAEAASPPQACA